MVCLQAARQAASELWAGVKLAVPDTTAVVVEATRAEEEFVCALARTISKALETKVVRRRIFGYIW
jgi:hypothetical protein